MGWWDNVRVGSGRVGYLEGNGGGVSGRWGNELVLVE